MSYLGYLLLSVLFVLGACSPSPPPHLLISAVGKNTEEKLSDIKIYIDSKFVGITDKNGNLSIRFDARVKKRLIVGASPVANDSAYLPTTTVVNIPFSYFPDDQNLTLVLSKIQEKAEPEIDVASEEIYVEPAEQVKLQENDLPEIAKIEANATKTPGPLVTPALPVATPPSKISSVLTKEEELSVSKPVPEPSKLALSSLDEIIKKVEAESKKPPEPKPTQAPVARKSNVKIETLKFHISHMGQPLENAQIHLGRGAHRTFSYIGVSDKQGDLEIKIPGILKGETILVSHSCCRPELRPLTGVTKEGFLIDLLPVPANVFLLKTDVYGFARVVPKLDLFKDQKRIETSGPAGVIIASGESGKSFLLKSADTFPEEIAIESKDNIVTGFLGLKKAAVPSVGWVDGVSGALEENVALYSAWRRFKREFIGSLMQQSIIRPVTEGEISTLAEAIGVESRMLAQKGWQFTLINPDLDFLIAMGVVGNSVSVKLLDRNGGSVMDVSREVSIGSVPENVARSALAEFLYKFPFEGTIVEKLSDKKLSVNLGEKNHLRIGDIFEIFAKKKGEPGGERNIKIGQATVQKIEPGSAVLVPTGEFDYEQCLGAKARRLVISQKTDLSRVETPEKKL